MTQKIVGKHKGKQISEMESVHCNLCRTSKPASEFYRQPDGQIRAGCKACRCAATSRRQRGRYRANPAAAKARHARWRARHPDQFREIMRKAVAKQRRQRREAGTLELPLNLPQNLPAPRAADAPPAHRPAPDECPPQPQPKPRKSKT